MSSGFFKRCSKPKSAKACDQFEGRGRDRGGQREQGLEDLSKRLCRETVHGGVATRMTRKHRHLRIVEEVFQAQVFEDLHRQEQLEV